MKKFKTVNVLILNVFISMFFSLGFSYFDGDLSAGKILIRIFLFVFSVLLILAIGSVFGTKSDN